MTTTQLTTSASAASPIALQRRPIAKYGIGAAVVASVTTTVLASIASAAGVSFSDGTDASIPTAAFAQLTLVFSLVGLGIAVVMRRKARRPRRTFVRTTVALTGLSFLPDVTVGFDPSSAVTLIMLHTVAAAIVVPTLARRLAAAR